MNTIDIILLCFYFDKIYEETYEIKEDIPASGIPEYVITHTSDKEVSKNHSELLSCASTFRVRLYIAGRNCFR